MAAQAQLAVVVDLAVALEQIQQMGGREILLAQAHHKEIMEVLQVVLVRQIMDVEEAVEHPLPDLMEQAQPEAMVAQDLHHQYQGHL